MKDYILIERINMFCPICDKTHDVELRERINTHTIKGVKVSYPERYYFCEYADEDENEYMTGAMLDENINNCLKAYYKKMKEV